MTPASLHTQRPLMPVLWFTGLPGAGKSTLALATRQRLEADGIACCLLDGDLLRHGLNADLGYDAASRRENIRRTSEVACLMQQAGLVTLVSLISPFREDRAWARSRIGAEHFVEIHVDAPLAVTEARDPKGLYHRARQGQIADFTGLTAPYEAPLAPTLHLQTHLSDIETCTDRILALLAQRPGLHLAPTSATIPLHHAPA